jgi:outer membrane protein TolC
MFEKRLTTAEETFRIDRSLLDAQLESATSVQDRINVLQNALEVAKKQEELASRQQQAGVVGPLAPLEAKADRLGLEIEMSKLTAK